MSFDPIQDSIEANREQASQKRQQHNAPLSSLLNPAISEVPPNNATPGISATIGSIASTAATAHAAATTTEDATYNEQPTSNIVLENPSPEAAENAKKVRKKRKNAPKEGGSSKEEDKSGYQTLLINSRARHLKKEDGEPYMRREIQFEFLMRLFFNHLRVFHNPYYGVEGGFDWPKHFRNVINEDGTVTQSDGKIVTFFELYLVTLLKSSKISKILKDRLMADINYALNFCVICLLVNIGRLNTTVNFDHEMKSQFRTYHSIPSLQVGNHLDVINKYYQTDERRPHLKEPGTEIISFDGPSSRTIMPSAVRSGSGYTMSTVKQLQDTPRIKSILKSVNDLNTNIPKSFSTFMDYIALKKGEPLNVVSLIFLLCVHEYEVGKSFFVPLQGEPPKPEGAAISTGSPFNDIWLKMGLRREDKVSRFMWLMYLFIETEFQKDKILSNPFNKPGSGALLKSLAPDVNITDEIIVANQKVLESIRDLIPDIHLDDDIPVDQTLNDIDTAPEVEFGQHMMQLRIQFVSEGHLLRFDTTPAHSSAVAAGANIPTKHGVPESQTKTLKFSGKKYNIEDSFEAKHEETEANSEEDGTSSHANGERRVKRRRRGHGMDMALPIKLSRPEIERLLNSEIKAINEHSKNAQSKRHRNHIYALFMKDLFQFKMDQLQSRRLSAGNVALLDTLASNLLLEGSREDSFDWGEFKINYYRVLDRVNGTINSKQTNAQARITEATAFIGEALNDVRDQ